MTAGKGEPVEKVLAANVRALMKAHAWTQAKLAKAAGIDQTTISRILAAKHKVQLDTLGAIAHAFDIEPYQLLIHGLNPKHPQILRSLRPRH